MTSNQPYLFRAIYDWIVDNGLTPYILVHADGPNVKVPLQSVQDGQIVLNIAPRAVSQYDADNDAVSFTARFGGVPETIYIPFPEIMAIYAAENGQGMVFSQEPETSPEPPEGKPDSETEKKPADDGKPFLKVIK